MIIGITIIIQTSGTNPLLGIDSYREWLNTHFYSASEHNLNPFITLLAWIIGITIGLLGYRISFYDMRKTISCHKKKYSGIGECIRKS